MTVYYVTPWEVSKAVIGVESFGHGVDSQRSLYKGAVTVIPGRTESSQFWEVSKAITSTVSCGHWHRFATDAVKYKGTVTVYHAGTDSNLLVPRRHHRCRRHSAPLKITSPTRYLRPENQRFRSNETCERLVAAGTNLPIVRFEARADLGFKVF